MKKMSKENERGKSRKNDNGILWKKRKKNRIIRENVKIWNKKINRSIKKQWIVKILTENVKKI